jgi:hypothetical protein
VEPGDNGQDNKESSPSESKSTAEEELEPKDEDEDPKNAESHDNSTLQAATDNVEPDIRRRIATVTREALQELPHLAINSKPKATAHVASNGGTKRKRETSPFDNPCADGAADSVRRKTQV